jgi:hypothetical protein
MAFENMPCVTAASRYRCDKAARRLMEHAHAFEPIQDGRVYIEKINGSFLFGDPGTPAEYRAGRYRAAGWICMRAARS